MAVCLNHTDNEAVTRCAACGKPLCSACIAARDGGRNYCSSACCEKGKYAAERAGGVINEKASTGKNKTVRLLIVVFLIIALAAAGFMFYKNNKKAVARHLDATLQQTKAAAAKTGAAVQRETQSGQQTLNTDSRYKRDREGQVK